MYQCSLSIKRTDTCFIAPLTPRRIKTLLSRQGKAAAETKNGDDHRCMNHAALALGCGCNLTFKMFKLTSRINILSIFRETTLRETTLYMSWYIFSVLAFSLLLKYSLYFSSTPALTFSIDVVFVLSTQIGNKPLSEPKLTKFFIAILRHQGPVN